MLFFILKLIRGLVAEDFFTVTKACEFHRNHEVLPDFQVFPKDSFCLFFFPQEIATCDPNKVNQQLCITS